MAESERSRRPGGGRGAALNRVRKNKAGKTPLDLAREGGFADVSEVLGQ